MVYLNIMSFFSLSTSALSNRILSSSSSLTLWLFLSACSSVLPSCSFSFSSESRDYLYFCSSKASMSLCFSHSYL